MKKVKQIIYLLFFASLIIITGLAVSCKDDSSLNSVPIRLLSFGPCPIPRGAVLRIIGTNLSAVKSVTLPGCDPISNIIRISDAEINITVPKTAESGKVILNAGGSNEVASITDLTIDGIISLTGFSPSTVKAGDIIKLEGEDLDFVNEVIFTSDVHVVRDSFISNTLTSIELKVPLEAQSGRLAVSDGATTPVIAYFEDELNVVLPAITSFSPETIKAGNELTITGTDFDLVKSVSFGGGKTAESFTLHDANTITVTVPADAQDGPVILTAFSGVSVPSAINLTMLVPTIISISPTNVKAGDLVTITGTDFDLISAVAFGGGKQQGEIQEGGTATEIQVKVPVTAKDGTVVLTTFANKTVESEESLTIIPTGGNEMTIWDEIVLSGWNQVMIPCSAFGELEADNVIRIYFSDIGGSGAEFQVFYGDWAPYDPAIDVKPEAGTEYYEILLTADMAQHIMNPSWGSDGMIIQGDQLTISKITIVTQAKETVLWSGNVGPIEWNANANTLVGPVDMSLVSAGQTFGVDFAVDSGGGQMEVYAGSWWVYLDGWMALNGGARYIKDCADSETNIEFTLTQSDIDHITEEGSTLFFAGNGIYIKRLYVK